MKHFLSCLFPLLLLGFATPLAAQTVLFSEDFEAEAIGAMSGTSAEGINWGAACPGCMSGDDFEVNDFGGITGGTILKGLYAEDTNGPATFSAGGIDANGCFLVIVAFDYEADGYMGSGNLECVDECGVCGGDPSNAMDGNGVGGSDCNNCWDYLAFRSDTGSGTFGPWTMLLGQDCNVPDAGSFASDPVCASPYDADGNLIPGNDPSDFSFEIEMAMWATGEEMIIDNVQVLCYTEEEAIAAGLAVPANCNPPPPVCAYTATVSNVSDCDPTDNTYDISITPSGTGTTPATGNLEVFIDGATTASASIPVATATTSTFMVTGLMADGAMHTVTFAWSGGEPCQFEDVPAYQAPADCTPICMVGMVDVGAPTCSADFTTYDVPVSVQFVNPPTTGTLDIDVQGTVVSLNPPFNSPMATTVTVPAAPTGPGTVSATFSADNACTGMQAFTVPDCTPPCTIDGITAADFVCADDGSTYDLTVSVAFTQPPATGDLTVSVDGTTMTMPVAASPMVFSFTGVPTGGLGLITAAFSDDAMCANAIGFSPPNCVPTFTLDCPADIVIPNPGSDPIFPGLPSFGTPNVGIAP